MPASACSSAASTSGGAATSGRAARASIEQARGDRAALGQRAVEAGRDLAARAIGDERDALAGLNRQAGLDGVARAGQQIG